MLAAVHLVIQLPVCCLETKGLKFTVVLYVGETWSLMLIEEPRERDWWCLRTEIGSDRELEKSCIMMSLITAPNIISVIK